MFDYLNLLTAKLKIVIRGLPLQSILTLQCMCMHVTNCAYCTVYTNFILGILVSQNPQDTFQATPMVGKNVS